MSNWKRRYRSDMTDEEVSQVEIFVRSLSYIFDPPHLDTRMEERGVSLAESVDTAYKGRLVEVNNIVWYDIRAAIRGPSHEQGYDCTVVVSLSRSVIITAWKNRVEDEHESLVLHKKTWNVDIPKLLHSLTLDTHTTGVVQWKSNHNNA